MNGKKYLLDTNAALYLLGGEILPSNLPDGEYAISVITELELLSFSKITVSEETVINQFLKEMHIIELSQQIKKQTVTLRRKVTLKLPDAIIAATAIETKSILVTRDKKLSRIQAISTLVL